MSRVCFQADWNLNHIIVDAAQRRESMLDFQMAHAADLLGVSNPEVLARAAHEGRLLVTYDFYDMPQHFATFLGRLKMTLTDRDLALQGISTDGSPLYPEPIRTVFGDVAHQICTCHGLKELTQGMLCAASAERHPWGRTSKQHNFLSQVLRLCLLFTYLRRLVVRNIDHRPNNSWIW